MLVCEAISVVGVNCISISDLVSGAIFLAKLNFECQNFETSLEPLVVPCAGRIQNSYWCSYYDTEDEILVSVAG